MLYDPGRHHRRTLRLQQLYSQTNTFVTLRCCYFEYDGLRRVVRDRSV